MGWNVSRKNLRRVTKFFVADPLDFFMKVCPHWLSYSLFNWKTSFHLYANDVKHEINDWSLLQDQLLRRTNLYPQHCLQEISDLSLPERKSFSIHHIISSVWHFNASSWLWPLRLGWCSFFFLFKFTFRISRGWPL